MRQYLNKTNSNTQIAGNRVLLARKAKATPKVIAPKRLISIYKTNF